LETDTTMNQDITLAIAALTEHTREIIAGSFF
jgi:hypothetical protein